MDTDKYDILDDSSSHPDRPDDLDQLSNADTVMESRRTARKKSRKPRGFKIALIIIAVLFVLFASFIYFLPHFLPMDTIRSIAKSKTQEMLGMDVDFTNLSFSWNGSVVLDGITLSPIGPEGEVGEPLLTVDEVRTSVAVSPLLSGNIIVNSVDVNGFSVRVRRNADGSMNLPDLTALAALPQREARPLRQRLSMAMAADTAQALPPIEIHRVNLRRGILGLDDAIENLSIAVGLETMTIEGEGLNDPFVFTGLLLPYPGETDKGDIPFSGRVALLHNGAFNPNGEAALEADVRAFSFHELAAQLGFGDLLQTGQASGLVKAALNEGKALVSIPDFRLANTSIGIDDQTVLALPDTSFSMNATYDPEPGVISFADLTVTNELNSLKAQGWMEGINQLADGLLPAVSIDYTGVVNFAKAAAYAASLNLGLDALPHIEGTGSYFGKLSLPQQTDPGQPLSPAISLDFNDGTLAARDDALDMGVNIRLSGVGARATATLAETLDINAGLQFQNLLTTATVPQLAADPISITLNGGVAATAGQTTGVELRLQNTRVAVPPTAYSGRMDISNPETRITYSLDQDVLTIDAMDFAINDAARGTVSSGAFTGILAGQPRGQADIAFSTVMETLGALFQPLIPEMATKLAGTVRSSTRVRLDGATAEGLVRAEVDNADIGVTLPQAQAAVSSPKTSVGLLASVSLDNPLAITISSLELNNSASAVQMADQRGDSVAGRFGVTSIKAAGVVDLSTESAELSNLTVAGNGMAVIFGQDGQQRAGMESGVMQIIAATPENKVVVPLSGVGAFALPTIDAGVDNFRFYLVNGEQRDISDFGNLRARLGIDGTLGVAGQQIINLRTAAFSAKPMAVNSRGQINLDTGAMVAEYAARVAPAAMGSLLNFLKLPPALVQDLGASGTMVWSGSQLDSKGMVQGQLRLATGEINPFEMAHDLSAALDQTAGSLAISIRRLDGNVKTASGEAVVTLAAQQSNLLLSRAGSKGLLDIRLNGAAGPTRMLAVGLTGIFPQFRDLSDMLYNSQASGIYNAWLQVSEKDANTIGLTLGGVWQGAALQMQNVPYLAEAGSLSAALDGEFAYRDNRIAISRMMFRSDSALIQGEGSAHALLSTDQNNSITGLANLGVDMRFVMADLSKLPLVFPGVVPADLGLAGRIDGQFKAGGDTNDIRVDQGLVSFQNFTVTPGNSVFAIPSGAANFGATVALQLNQPASTGSPYDVFKLFTIQNGQVTLTGAQLQSRPINTLSSTFNLQNGILTLTNAQMAVEGTEGTSAVAAGTVDFNTAAPAVNVQLAVRNFPMAEVNPEIAEYMQIQSGLVNLPASGQAAGVSFQGLSENEILSTLRLENFNFATGPVVDLTGPVLNAELDKARALMKQDVSGDNVRTISFQSISGTVAANGDGRIVIPGSAPIIVVGDNTGDFKVQGHVLANHTMDMDFFITGKLENLIGFSLPSIIPNLRSGSEADRRSFMDTLNKYAAEGRYKVKMSGSLDNPDLSGIGQVARHFLTDIMRAAPGQVLGGVLELGKDAPGAVLDAAGAILNPENITNPSNIIKAPVNIGRGIGRAFGIGGGSGGE